MQIITNNVPRDILYGFDLPQAMFDPGGEFDYLELEEWSGFAYKGEFYDLGEFTHWDNPVSPTREGWDGFRSDGFFSGLAVRFTDDCEQVVVSLVLS